jgi:hypothetical protein
MNCDRCQRRLLSAEDPVLPSLEVQAHLAGCPDCQAWQRQLLLIERSVPRIPIPRSAGKSRLLVRLFQGASEPSQPTAPAPAPTPAPPRRWRFLSPRLAGVAAAILLVVCGYLLGSLLSRSFHQPPATGPQAADAQPVRALVARLIECDLRLAEADTPRKRVEALTDAAEALDAETRALSAAADPDDLKELAQLYDQVVRDGVVPRARDLPRGQRRQVLDPIVAQLARTEQEANQLAGRATPAAAASLRLLAAAAGHGDRQLRALMNEEATP